ncbi:MAG: ribose 5-phosphate isomerase B [Acidobacteria bacterium]|nr:ribose 5-phosphate isomerase B [Acidobacteriota bacterium]
MKYAIGCDHAGFGMKEAIKSEFDKWGEDLLDCGTHGSGAVDYPDYGRAVAERVAKGECERGILICGTGIGMSIVANRYAGVRAALCFNEEMAELSRQHNDANILVLPGRCIPIGQAVKMVRRWMTTPFEEGRHSRRVQKMEQGSATD